MQPAYVIHPHAITLPTQIKYFEKGIPTTGHTEMLT